MEPFQPKSILCPTDFSEPATLALRYAKQFSICFDAKLIVLYAESFTAPPYFTSGQMNELTKEIDISRQAARDYLAAYVRNHLGDSPQVETMLLERSAVEAVVETATKLRADMIVMGTHGRSGVNRLMLGSVTEKILHETDRPVLTVREKSSGAEFSKVSIQQVLCPVNYTEIALKALEHAVEISKCFKAELLVLHVIESESTDIKDEDEHYRLCAWIPEGVRARCSLKEIVRRGDAAEQIIEVASSARCDMIVLGAQHKRFHDTTVLGTTTIRVTRHAPCPVLTVIRK